MSDTAAPTDAVPRDLHNEIVGWAVLIWGFVGFVTGWAYSERRRRRS